MAPTEHRLTLLTRPHCALCDEARTALARVAGELGVPWDERNITDSLADQVEYADRVPVILLDGVEHGYWRVEEARLRAALAR
ncbi:MAG: glutaredoxin family protein [Mycobacteriales bacterium]